MIAVKNNSVFSMMFIWLFLAFGNVVYANYGCAAGFMLQGSWCFVKGNQQQSWTNAEADCISLTSGSHLAALYNTSTETDFQTYRTSQSLLATLLWVGCKKSGATYTWTYDNSIVSNPPTDGNTYCQSDASFILISTNGNTPETYICMAAPMVIVAGVSIQATQLATRVGTSVTFTAAVEPLADSSMNFLWSFGDTTTTSTSVVTAAHSYSIPGIYSATVTVNNNVSAPITSTAIQVTVYKNCSMVSCSAPISETGTSTVFQLIINAGFDCSINLFPGTGLTMQPVGTLSNTEASSCTTTNPLCGPTNNQWTKTFSYTYANPGVYTAISSAYNNLSQSNASCIAVAQDSIQGLAISAPITLKYYPFNSPVVIELISIKGSSVTFTAAVDGNLVYGFWKNNYGNVSITSASMNNVGPKTAFLSAYNNVSNNSALSYAFQVEYLFQNFKTIPAGVYLNASTAALLLTWSNASHFTCTVTPQSPATSPQLFDFTSKIVTAYDQSINVDVSAYTSPGSYIILVNASNHVDTFYRQLNVVVQYPIPSNCIQFKIEFIGNLSTAPGSTAPAIFSVYWTCGTTVPWPTNASIDFDFSENGLSKILNIPYLDTVTNYTRGWNYTTSDVFPVNITIKNLVSSLTFVTNVDIVVDLVNVNLNMTKYQPFTGKEPHYFCLQTGEIVGFTVTLSAGTLFNVTMYFNDSAPSYSTYTKNSNSISFNRSYSSPGQYNVTAVVQNYARQVNVALIIPSQPFYLIVMDPVSCGNFTPLDGLEPVITYLSNGTYYRILITPNINCDTVGSNVRYTSHWGDGNIENNNLTDAGGETMIGHWYNTTGIFNISIVLWNEVSSFTYSTSIHVYNKVTGANIEARWINASNSNMLMAGYHPMSSSGYENQAYFDLDYPVRFTAKRLFGSDVTLTWTFSDGYTNFTSNATFVDRSFGIVGPFTITLLTKNNPTHETFTYAAIVERATKNPNITDNSPFPIDEKPYQQYVVSMDVVGTDSCYYFDISDNYTNSGAKYKRYVIYGNKAMCESFLDLSTIVYDFTKLETKDLEFTPTYDNETTDLDNTGSLDGKTYINFTRKFNQLGLHYINFTVINHVYQMTFIYPSVVTKGWCRFPVVSIRNMNKCQNTDNCKCFFNNDTICIDTNDTQDGDRVVYMKDKILIDASVTIDCPSSPNIWFGWSVQELNLNYPATAIKNSTQLIQNLNHRSYTAKILVVPPNYMPGGRYQFRLTVWPESEIDMERWDTTNIYLQASYLAAEFVGEMAGRHVPYNGLVIFDGWTDSYDPDLTKENKTGLKFAFYCRRACEDWPQNPSVNFTYSSFSGYSSASCTPADGSQNGCFPGLNTGPMALAGSSPNGEWSINSSYPGIITINTQLVNPGVWYALFMLVSKDDGRVSYKEIFFYASKLTVPDVKFICVTNCQKSFSPSTIAPKSGRYYNRVNPPSRFSVEPIIEGFKMDQTYFYQWDILSRSPNKDNNLFAPSNGTTIPQNLWGSYASTGMTIRTISLQPGWWANTASKPGFYLKLQLWVGSKSSGTTGEYFYEFFFNNPPQNCSTCKCVPNYKATTSLSSTFGITCSNFKDSNNGELYYFVKQLDVSNPEFWLDIGCNYTVYVQPVPGPVNATTAYQAQFRIQIFDSSGSYVNIYTSSIVYSFDMYWGFENPVWSILNYTTYCQSCADENYYLQLTKVQQCFGISNIIRTFSSMLNLNPSTGCLPTLCDNATAIQMNCTVGDEIELMNIVYEPVPATLTQTVVNILGKDWVSLSECQLDLQLRQHIREELLAMFSTLAIPYFSQFSVVMSAMYPATLIPQENTIAIMAYVEKTLQEGVAHIDGVDSQMEVILEADVREEACKILTGIVANMEQTTNYHGAIWREAVRNVFPAFSMEGLLTDIKLYDQMITNNISANYSIFQYDNTAPMWTLENVTLDTDVVNEVMLNRFNIIQITALLNRIRKLKQKVTDYVQARKVMGESPSIISTQNITAVYHKTPVKNMTKFPMDGVGGCEFQSASAAEMFGDLNSLEETMMGSLECAKNNPFTTDKTSIGLSRTVSVAFQNSSGTVPVVNLTKPMDIFIPRNFDHSLLVPIWNTTEPFSKPMTVYSFTLNEYMGFSFVVYEGWIDVPENATINYLNDTELTTKKPTTMKGILTTLPTESNSSDETLLNSGGSNLQEFAIFVKFWTMFDLDNKYHYYCVVPKWDESTFNASLNPTAGDPRTCTLGDFSFAGKNDDKDATQINVFLAVQSIPHKYSIKDFKNKTKIEDFNDANFVPVNYTLYSILASCMYYDDSLKVWKANGTEIGPNTTRDVTHCKSSHLTAFSSGFSVPMNSLNLQANPFLHLAENPIAFVFCLCLFCLYLILMVWCRRKDKEDLKKAGIAPLPDNDPRDRYLYEIVFYTGTRPNAGTTAKVFFQLTGENKETDVRMAEDAQRKAFQRNGIDTFIMAVNESLGKLNFLRIWHDNSGTSPAWYFSRMQIMDVQTGEQHFFVVNNWLAVEEADGQVERIVPVAGKGDLTDFNQLFWQKSNKNLFDGHIWFSVFRRPPRSHFTRVQRLTCCLSLIYCTMVANILFYKTDTGQTNDVILSIGPIVITWTSMKTGIIAALIVAPVNTVLVLLFRYAKPIPIKSPMQEYMEKQKQIKKDEKLAKQKEENQKIVKTCELKSTESVLSENKDDIELEVLCDCDHKDEQVLLPKNLEAEPPKVVHIDTRAPKKRFWLPHWVIYIGYMLAFITVGVAFWLIMQIAFGFGRTKALDWVIAMFISLIQSIIFIQPIKIIAMAIVYSVLCKKPEKDEYEPSEIELREDEVYVHEDQATIEDLKNSSKRAIILQKLQRTRKALPPDLQLLQSARAQRLQELAMMGLIKEILFYTIFLYTLMMAAYGERDALSFPMIRSANDLFISGKFYDSPNKTTFDSIAIQNDFFAWANDILLPSLFPQQDYSGKPVSSESKYIVDNQGYLAGTVRLRQLRVNKDSCKISPRFSSVIHHCRGDYSVINEDWGTYKKRWVQLSNNETAEDADDYFTWKNMTVLNGKPFVGLITSYWGGGYVTDLGNDGEIAANIMQELEETTWLDAHTRAVFVDFSVYYSAVNMMLVSNLLVEFMSVGSCRVYPQFVSFCLDPYSSATGVPVLIAQICCLLFLFYFIYREIRKLMREKWKYFKVFSNWLEMLVIALFITALVMYFHAYDLRKSLVSAYAATPNKFINFSSVIFWDQVYSWMLYLALFIANIKFLKLLRFNRRISMMVDTLTYGWRYMLAFFCTFLLVFMAFVSSSFTMFCTDNTSFMSFMDTVESLLVVMLNKFNWSDFNMFFGPVFFIVFTLLMNFILVNMFLSIVNDSFSVVKADSIEKTNDFELVDFVWNKFLRFFGFRKSDVDLTEGGPMYTEELDEAERDLNDCNDKIEEMIFKMEDFFREEHVDEEMKMDWRYKDKLQNCGVTKRHIVSSD